MLPLQFGVPGGPELLIILLIGLVIGLLIPLALGYFVYNDATNRGNDNAALWAVVVAGLTAVTFFGGLAALAVYIWQRE
jgi:predicted exporter